MSFKVITGRSPEELLTKVDEKKKDNWKVAGEVKTHNDGRKCGQFEILMEKNA